MPHIDAQTLLILGAIAWIAAGFAGSFMALAATRKRFRCGWFWFTFFFCACAGPVNILICWIVFRERKDRKED